MTTRRTRTPAQYQVIDGVTHRLCHGMWIPYDDLHFHRNNRGRLHSRCVDCTRVYQAEYHAKYPRHITRPKPPRPPVEQSLGIKILRATGTAPPIPTLAQLLDHKS